eukprot:TRINITY_DN3970_c2_g3_i1.p1 TRINITY_DN3970_c2_g3~~TRINITY_DN3970_c2_g3_i1.p1  ORF type:complete len:835 (+),score=230.15 TRINITY_DN3970_c2_g3_i1:172-2676(+)
MNPVRRWLQLLRRTLAREGDSATEVIHKLATFWYLAVWAPLLCLKFVSRNKAGPWASSETVAVLHPALLVLSVGSLAWLFHARRLSKPYVRFLAAWGTVALTMGDFGQAAVPGSTRLWPALLVMVHWLLHVRAERWLTAAVAVWVCLYLAAVDFERLVRFGLFDLEVLDSYEARRQWCDCARPPCAYADRVGLSEAVAAWPQLSSAVVFTVCFLMARSVKALELQEAARMEATVTATQSVAESLSTYNLDAAEGVLAEHAASLPPDLLEYFHTLLANLGSYRPYLPQEFFVNDHGDPQPPRGPAARRPPAVAVPGLLVPKAAVVFTDIRSSTSLWENSAPEAMPAALATHNRVIRDSIAAHRGYEVKTIGDAFMVTFDTAWAAVCFGLEVQTRLCQDNLWPAGLARTDASDGFGLLAVRIGVHWDGVRAEENVLTRRYDYFGCAVNKAARVERRGIPGTVTVTEEAMMAIEDRQGELEALAVVEFTDESRVKGIAQPLWLATLLPKNLARLRTQVHAYARWQRGQPEVPAGADMPPLPASPGDFSCGGAPVDADAVVRRSSACAGTVKFFGHGDLARLHSILVATRGHMTSVTGNAALVSWGVHGTCRQPANEAVRFVISMYNDFAGGSRADKQFYAGLATGAVASGRVKASVSQRFVTLLGPCVEVSAALCSGAAELGTGVLLASLGAVYQERFGANEYLRAHIRPVDVWTLGSCVDSFEIFELRLETLAVGAGGAWLQQPRGRSGWSAEQLLAFRARDVDALGRLARAAGKDHVLAAVVQLLRSGAHLAHALAQGRRRAGAAGKAGLAGPPPVALELDSASDGDSCESIRLP